MTCQIAGHVLVRLDEAFPCQARFALQLHFPLSLPRRRRYGMKFVVVLYIDPQAGVERGFCIGRCELFFVMFQIEIEWITGIHVDEDQIHIIHE
jgi:hypothetical protein